MSAEGPERPPPEGPAQPIGRKTRASDLSGHVPSDTGAHGVGGHDACAGPVAGREAKPGRCCFATSRRSSDQIGASRPTLSDDFGGHVAAQDGHKFADPLVVRGIRMDRARGETLPDRGFALVRAPVSGLNCGRKASSGGPSAGWRSPAASSSTVVPCSPITITDETQGTSQRPNGREARRAVVGIADATAAGGLSEARPRPDAAVEARPMTLGDGGSAILLGAGRAETGRGGGAKGVGHRGLVSPAGPHPIPPRQPPGKAETDAACEQPEMARAQAAARRCGLTRQIAGVEQARVG